MTTRVDLDAISSLNKKYVPSGDIYLTDEIKNLVTQELELKQRTDIELQNILVLATVLCASDTVFPEPFPTVTPEEYSRLTESQLKARKHEIEAEQAEVKASYRGMLQNALSVIKIEQASRKE